MTAKRGNQVGRGESSGIAAALRIVFGSCALSALLPMMTQGAAPQSPNSPSLEEQIARYVKHLDIDALLGQTLMVGVQAGEIWPKANEQLGEVIAKYKVGGVLLTEDNFPRQYQIKDDEEMVRKVVALTRFLQKSAFEAQSAGSRIPLLIAIDQEGGSNMMVEKGTTAIPNHVFLGGTRSQELTEKAGFVIGSEMRALGVNVVLAPVADINNNAESDIIGKRSFGSHKDIVAPLSVAFAQGLQRAQVLAVAKHFPGHGTSADDPHNVLPQLGTKDWSQMKGNDLMPFRELIASRVDGIMTAHILATPLDEEYPITISKKAIEGLLRNEMAFQGLVFTDDLASMKGILLDEKGKLARTHLEVGCRALSAGSDVLVFGQLWLNEYPEDPTLSLTVNEFDEIYRGLRLCAKENRPLLEKAVARILRAKARLIRWSDFGDLSARQVNLDWESYQASLQTNSQVAIEAFRESAILISEDGKFPNEQQPPKYFVPGRGPLSKGVLLDAGDRLTLVSPVFQPPDELLQAVSGGWLPKDQIDSVHLVYGWRNDEALKRARDIWGEKERVEKLVIKVKGGKSKFQWEAIDRKVDEIIDRSVKSRLILFGVLLREHLEVLKKVSDRLPADKKILVLLFLEPYFVPRDLYLRKNMVFLYVSPLPTIKLADKLLFGEWAPQPVSRLPVSLPTLINREADPGEPVKLFTTKNAEKEPSRRNQEVDRKERSKRSLLPPVKPDPFWGPRRVLIILGGLLLLGLVGYWQVRLRSKLDHESPPETISTEAGTQSPNQLRLPDAAINNLWYRYTNSETVIVFVHGILSDSRDCWHFRDPHGRKPSQYWPAMIQEDKRFGDVGIYLGGYYTAIDAGSYEIKDCAREIFDALAREPEVSSETPVLNRRRMLFVCHSTGGIVVRYLLENYVDTFKSKDIGLVLIASPSYGARYADRLELLSRFYHQNLGLQLRWGNWSLRQLDSVFKDLVDSRRIPGLYGIEAVENHFIFHRKWLPDARVVVTEESAGRYFGAAVLLRKTDHFSAVKPDSRRHPAYELLLDFWTRKFFASRTDPPSAA